MKDSRFGEVCAMNYLRRHAVKIKDVTGIKEYQKQDIDLLCENQNGQKFSVEVKWDRKIHRTGNAFIELVTDLDKNEDGWFKFCKATYIFYGDAENRLFYIIDRVKLAEYIEAHKELKRVESKEKYYYKDEDKISLGVLVPMSNLMIEKIAVPVKLNGDLINV